MLGESLKTTSFGSLLFFFKVQNFSHYGTLRAIGSSGHLAHSNLKPAAVTGLHFTLCLSTPLAYGIWAEVWHGKAVFYGFPSILNLHTPAVAHRTLGICLIQWTRRWAGQPENKRLMQSLWYTSHMDKSYGTSHMDKSYGTIFQSTILHIYRCFRFSLYTSNLHSWKN